MFINRTTVLVSVAFALRAAVADAEQVIQDGVGEVFIRHGDDEAVKEATRDALRDAVSQRVTCPPGLSLQRQAECEAQIRATAESFVTSFEKSETTKVGAYMVVKVRATIEPRVLVQSELKPSPVNYPRLALLTTWSDGSGEEHLCQDSPRCSGMVDALRETSVPLVDFPQPAKGKREQAWNHDDSYHLMAPDNAEWVVVGRLISFSHPPFTGCSVDYNLQFVAPRGIRSWVSAQSSADEADPDACLARAGREGARQATLRLLARMLDWMADGRVQEIALSLSNIRSAQTAEGIEKQLKLIPEVVGLGRPMHHKRGVGIIVEIQKRTAADLAKLINANPAFRLKATVSSAMMVDAVVIDTK